MKPSFQGVARSPMTCILCFHYFWPCSIFAAVQFSSEELHYGAWVSGLIKHASSSLKVLWMFISLFLNQIFQKYMLSGQNKKGLQCFKDCSFSVSLSGAGKIAFISCFIGVRPESQKLGWSWITHIRRPKSLKPKYLKRKLTNLSEG